MVSHLIYVPYNLLPTLTPPPHPRVGRLHFNFFGKEGGEGVKEKEKVGGEPVSFAGKQKP